MSKISKNALFGIDISHHQGVNFLKQKFDTIKPGFVIMKATEGVSFTDSCYMTFASQAEEKGALLGFYHYARPDKGNLPKDEAAYFYQRVKPYVGKAIFVLDWEQKSLSYPVQWALEFLKEFERLSGVKPMIYVQQSYVKYMDIIRQNGNGLWVARYTGAKTPDPITPYSFYAIWQYASPGHNFTGKTCLCDYDTFNGTAEQFKKYM